MSNSKFFTLPVIPPRDYQLPLFQAFDSGIRKAVFSLPRRCISAGTDILMADGTYSPIENIKPGDMIISYNTDLNTFEKDEVVNSWFAGDKECIKANDLIATPDHRVYSKSNNFVRLDEVNSIGLYNGEFESINSVTSVGIHPTYDLEIKKNSNFIANGYIVHNSGKDLLSASLLVREAFKRSGNYYLLAETKEWAKRIYWSGQTEVKYYCPIERKIKKRSGSLLDIVIPDELRGKTNLTESKIILPNGSIINLGGTDDRSFVGTAAHGFVISEYSLHGDGVIPVIMPIITETNGFLVVNGTQRETTNHLLRLINSTKNNKDWYTVWKKANDLKQYYWVSDDGEIVVNPELAGKVNPFTKVPYENIEDLVRIEPWNKILYMREYLNYPYDLEQSSIYGEIIVKVLMYSNGSYNSSLPVYTAWDIGMSDRTCIVFYQVDETKKITVIDYIERNNEAVGYFINQVRSKPYRYGRHFFPADAKARSFHSGSTLTEFCRVVHNFNVTALSRPVSLNADLELCKIMLNDAQFVSSDAIKVLTDHLMAYSRDNTGKPKHDVHSNGADAFRYACTSVNLNLAVPVLQEYRNYELSDYVNNNIIEPWTNEGLPNFCE